MKRLFYVTLAIIMLTACSNRHDNEHTVKTFDGAHYIGTVTVQYNNESYENNPITVDFTLNNKRDSVSITIYSIKFVPQMPVTIDVTIPSVKYAITDNGIVFSADKVVPYMGVVPVERYLVTGLDGTIAEDKCNFSVNFGPYPTTFSGTEVLPLTVSGK